METQGRAAEVTPAAATTKARAGGWLVSPAFDLLFFANAGWLLLLVPGVATRRDTALDFWQLYYLTLPHRWITLVLVLTDADRRRGHARQQVAVAALAAAVVLGVSLGSGAFLCLALLDFVWNAWHFASQHAGVLRIYARKVGGGVPWLERWGLRLFVTYAALRAASLAAGWSDGDSNPLVVLHALDWLILVTPVSLIATNLAGFRRDRVGKLAYLLSVCGLYTGLLGGVHFGSAIGVVSFAAAGSMFHAVEYLAIVTHYARRRAGGGPSAFRSLARSWAVFLGVYVVALGSAGSWLSQPEHGFAAAWQGLNLWASFVHYAFDGMIWKLRRPDTAAALGAGTS